MSSSETTVVDVVAERTEGDRGEQPKASEAKGGGEHCDPGDVKGCNELTALQLCEEVKRRKAGDLEEEGLSSGETIESHTVLERPVSKQSASHSAKEPVRTKVNSTAWRSARACREGHAHPTNPSHSRLAGVLAQRGKTLGVGAGTDADIGSMARGRSRVKARRTTWKAMRTGSDSARDEGVCALGGGECDG